MVYPKNATGNGDKAGVRVGLSYLRLNINFKQERRIGEDPYFRLRTVVMTLLMSV